MATLTDFDDDFTTVTGGRTGEVDLKNLPDGEYEFAVKKYAVKDTSSGPLVSMKLEILGEGPNAGLLVDRAYFLTRVEDGIRVKNERQIAQLRDDLKLLGFDVDNWTKPNSRPFSAEVNRVGAVIVDVCLKAKKKQGGKKNDGTHYQNLDFVARSATDGKPEKFGAKEMDEANADPFGD